MISIRLVVYFSLALSVSFVCSILEAVLLSVSRPYVELLRQQGRPAGRILHKLKQRIDRPLIAILTLNTLANMSGAAGVGAETARLAAQRGIDDTVPVAVAAGVLTLAVLVLSEIIPKTVGATYWRQLAGPGAQLIRIIVTVLGPVVAVLEVIPRSIATGGTRAGVSRDELAVLAEMGGRSGAILRRESEVIGNLLRLNQMRVKDVRTPRVDVFALPETMTAQEAAQQHTPMRYSRIPVFGESIDEVTGVVLKARILEACQRSEGGVTLAALKQPLHIVPETKTLTSLLDEFSARTEHLFLVVNEYGGTEGVVTLEDVIEALLGVEITDETDDLAAAGGRRARTPPRP